MRVANICILTTKEDAGDQIYGCLIYNIKEMSMHEKVPVDTTVGERRTRMCDVDIFYAEILLSACLKCTAEREWKKCEGK